MVLGVRRLANASLARAQAVHGHDQQGLGILQDKVSVREREAREREGKGGRHVHDMERKGPSPHFNQHKQGHALMQGMQENNIITFQKWFRLRTAG
jgi:hypothetical protein